jgi:voltage-gated potassium channel
LGQFIASFVMILGYGIIAVPTGIVTAELQRTHDKVSILKKPCTECGTEDYPTITFALIADIPDTNNL